MRGLVVEADAEADIAAALDWYEQQEPGLGAGLVAELDEVIDGLRWGRLRGLGVPDVQQDLRVRRVLLTRFPYAVIFVDHADSVHVLAFAHQKRRRGPGPQAVTSSRLRARTIARVVRAPQPNTLVSLPPNVRCR